MQRLLPRSQLIPYTTLCRSGLLAPGVAAVAGKDVNGTRARHPVVVLSRLYADAVAAFLGCADRQGVAVFRQREAPAKDVVAPRVRGLHIGLLRPVVVTIVRDHIDRKST